MRAALITTLRLRTVPALRLTVGLIGAIACGVLVKGASTYLNRDHHRLDVAMSQAIADGRASTAGYPARTFALEGPVPGIDATTAILADQAIVQAQSSEASDDLQTEVCAIGGLGASSLVALAGLGGPISKQGGSVKTRLLTP